MQNGELILIRHAPIADSTRLCGRTDLPARIVADQIARTREIVGQPDQIYSSPALRCCQTVQALWPSQNVCFCKDLWEQNFGLHDGLHFAELPDIGTLEVTDLASYRPPGGESFVDVCHRVGPVLDVYAKEAAEKQARIAIICHAGVIRAGIGLTLRSAPTGLGFEIAPLSVTRLRTSLYGLVSVIGANQL